MSRKLLTRCLPIVLILWALPAFSQTENDSKDAQRLQQEAARLDEQARQSNGNKAVFESLSNQLKVPATTLQSQQQSTKFGFGQLFIANSLAQATGKNFDQIAREFQSGKGWGQIAKENDVKLGKVVSESKRANKQLKSEHSGGPNKAAQAPNQHGPNGSGGPKGKGPK